jgi:hypothetical protein
MEVLGLLLGLAALIVLPFLLLGALFKVLFAVILLPFRLLGALVTGLFGLVAGILGVAASGVGLIVAV